MLKRTGDKYFELKGQISMEKGVLTNNSEKGSFSTVFGAKKDTF